MPRIQNGSSDLMLSRKEKEKQVILNVFVLKKKELYDYFQIVGKSYNDRRSRD